MFDSEEKRLTAPVPSDNPYDAAAASVAEKSVGPARVAIRAATGSSPDAYAEAKKISATTGIPADVAERNLPEAQKEAATWKYDALLKRDPGLAEALATTDLARVAPDEIDKLAAMRDFLSPRGAFGKTGGAPYARPEYLQFSTPAERTPGNYLGGLTTGFAEQGSQIREGVRRMFADAIGSSEMGADAQRRAAQSESRQFLATPEHKAWWEGDIYGGVASLTQSVPAIALTFANPPLGLAAMGLQQQAPAYNKYRDRGASPVIAALASGIEGVAEAAFEVAPMGFAVKNLGKVGMRTFIAGLLGREIPTEIATTIAQTATDTAFANPDKTWGQWASALPAEIRSTVVGTLIMSGAFAGAHKVAQAGLGFQQQTDKATADAAALQQLMEASGTMNLPKRDTPTFTQFVNDAAAQGPVDSVYIDATTFAQAAQEAGVDLKTTMPETAAALDEAVATKSDVRIPLGEFAANSTLFQPEIVQHLKTDPNGATLVETQDAAWVKETQVATEKALAQQEFTDAIRQSYEVVKGELKKQLDTANRFTSDVNDAKAGYAAAMYKTLAVKHNITPEQAYVRWPIDIASQNFEGTNVLSQMPAEPLLNVGLNVPGGRAISQADVVAALKAIGVDAVEVNVHQSNTEPTAVVTLSRPLTPQEGHDLSVALKQEAIVQHANGQGALYGPNAAAWGEYNPDFFLLPSGVPASASNLEHRIGEAQARGQMATFEQADTGTPGFARWSDGDPIIPAESLDNYNGEPAVLQVYHGTTGDFNSFKAKIANPESDLGAGFYFSNSTLDVSANYAGEGPDLTQKIQLLAARIAQETEREYDDPAVVAEAKKRLLVQHGGYVLPVFVHLKKPVIIGGPFTTRLYLDRVEDADGDFISESGTLIDFITALHDEANVYGRRHTEEVGAKLYEQGLDGGVSVLDLMTVVRNNEVFGHIENDEGQFVFKEVVRKAFERIGFDGIVDNTVGEKFGDSRARGQKMVGVHDDTVHVVAFKATQIKSAIGNTGAYSKRTPNILRQDAAPALKLPTYGSPVPGSISVVGVHFSKEARPVLLSSAMGTGMAGAEQARAPMQRINFYVNQGSGVTPERDVGSVPHAVRLNSMYDASADRLNLFKGVDANTAEQAVVAHGFSGYYSRDFANGQGAAVLLGQHAVQAQVLTDTKAITEVPPPRDATPERELAEALVAVKGLPNGQMSGPEWIVEMWKAAPQIASQIPESALAALEAHTDLMYRDEVARTFYQVTPEVSKFLEGSAVQQVVYHGTGANIEIFDNSKASLPDKNKSGAIWFSTAPEVAGEFAGSQKGETVAGMKLGHSNIIPVYLNIKNPYVDTYGKYAKGGGATQAEIEALKAEGYDGIHWPQAAIDLPDTTEQGPVKGYYRDRFGKSWADSEQGYPDQWAVFDHNQIMSALSGQMMQGESAPRGQISFGSDIRATPTVLTMLANADLSTFHHELGHFYLEILFDVANQPDAPPEMVRDAEIVLKWFGVKDIAAWNAMSLEAKRPFHEMFARGHEMKLFEGKAPSLELQPLYARFRSWIMSVYQDLKKLDITLTDEVRGVYDRMVATNEEILQAETARTFAPLYETKPEGMTDAEWGDYHVLGGDATQEAVDQLQTRSLRDMQYASNAKSAALKRLQQRAEMLRKGVRAEVSAEVNAEPIYQVMRFLKTGVYEGENAGNYTTHRLDIATLDEMYPENMADRPPLLNLANMRGHDGIAPDVVAQMFGYGSGDVLVRELLKTEPIQNKIAGITDQRMLERYGDIADPAAMEKAANAAVHNEVRAKFIATEMRTLDKAAGNKPTLMAMAREFAATLIARKKIRTIRPAIYTAAAAKAAKNADTAFRKDDVATAAGEKRNQLVNVYASRFASDAIDEVEKSVAYLKRVGESKSIDPEYRSQINALLERFDMRKTSGPEAARRQSLVQWMESQREKGFEPAIDPALENEALRKPYQDMTLEEFRGLVDSIKNIEHLGRLKSKLLKLADQRAFAVIVKDVADSIEHNAKKTLPHETEAKMSGRKQILAMHTKLSSFMRQFDGWLDNGIMQRLFVHSSNAAGAVEAQMHEAATVKLINLFEPLLANESKAQAAGRQATPFGLYRGYFGEKTFIPEINESLSREARLMVALNTGTEGNLQRLMDGDHWTDKQVQAVVDTLTKQEMDFVQSVWNFIGEYKSPVGEQQKRLTGVEPTWIPARQVVTKHGIYAGGYLPAKYNGALSSRSLSDEAAADLTDALRATRGSAAARASFTKERAAKVVNRPLRKDFGVITQHLTEVTHRLAWQEWLVDVNRILRASPVDQAIRAHYGPEVLASIRENIEAIAIGNVGAENALERGVNYLRTGATIAGLGWRLTTSLLQPIGLTQSMVRIGPKWIGKGLVSFLGDAAHMENSFSRIAKKSEMMRLRAKTMQREISEIQDTVTGEGGPIKASFFYLIQKMQLVADIPTWLGQYEKALATSGIQDPAALEANAIAQADQAVLDAQGAGQAKDLPAVLRGSPYLKLWTNFASFFIGTTFQLTREAVGRTDFKSPAGVLMLAADFVLLYSLPAALGTLMKYALSDDDDEGKLIRTLISDQLSYMLGTMIGLRELGSAARSAVGLPGDYGGPAGGRILGEITKLGKQVQQGEADEAFWKAINSAAGVIFHYPAGQINSTADGIAAMAEGKTTNPGVLAVGSSKK